MNATKFGVLIGAVLAIVWITVNFGAMILVALAMAIGALVGALIQGRLSVAGIAGLFQGKRSSS